MIYHAVDKCQPSCYIDIKCGTREETDTGTNIIYNSPYRRKEYMIKVIVYAVSIGLVLLTLYPFFMMIVDFTGFKSDNPARVLRVIPQRGKQFVRFIKSRVVLGFINSVIISASSTILNVYFSAMTAYSITAYKWKPRKIFSNFILAMMMIPTVVASSGFINLAYKYHMNNKLITLILPAIATPLSVVFMRLYLESAFSMEIVYQARIDGAGEFRIFNKIVLPIMKPAIATMAIFALAHNWNDYSLPLVLITEETKKTLPQILAFNYALGETTIPMVFSTVPLIIAYLFLAKYIVEGVQLGSVKL